MREFISIIDEGQDGIQEKPADHGVTFFTSDGHITIASYPNSPRKHSIVSFYVEPEARGHGVGRELLKYACSRFDDIGAQVDGAASLKLFYELGFRNSGDPEGSLADYERVRQEDSSIFMAMRDREGRMFNESVEPERYVVYHGTNQNNLTELMAGSWVSEDPEVAMEFAQEKCDNLGGAPAIYTLTVDDNDVDWDHLSAMAGVDDLRGQLMQATPAKLV